MNGKEKFVLVIFGVEALACGVFAAWCYARAQYHQGRIDAANEIREKLIEMKEEILQENSLMEEP